MAGIKKRGNSYELSVSHGYDANGKKIKPTTKTIKVPDTVRTERQLEKYLQEQAVLFQNEVDNNTYFNGNNMTLGEYARKWLERAEKDLAPSTLKVYRTRIERRIIPALGHHKLAKLQKHHINDFYDTLSKDGSGLMNFYYPSDELVSIANDGKAMEVSSRLGVDGKTLRRIKDRERLSLKTVKKISKALNMDIDSLFEIDPSTTKLSKNTVNHHHDLLSAILSSAVDDDLIGKSPLPKAPPTTKTKIAYYEEDEAAAFLEALESEPLKYRVMGYLLIDTGVRRSELAGLEWKHVDLKNGTIAIEQQRQYVSKKEVIRGPKTDNGIRKISLSPTVVGLLKEYQRYQKQNRLKLGDAWIDTPYVFRHEDGKAMAPTSSYGWLRRFIKKHGLSKITVHGMRHTHASLLIGLDTDIVTVSSRLGHGNKNVTLNTYSHQLKSKEKEAVNKMDAFYNRGNEEQNTNRVSK